MITIPNVKGKSLRETKNKFDDWGLRYDQVKEIYSFNTEKGKVVKTDPQIGSQVNYGDLITINISKGKTYPVFIVLFAFLLIGLLLGKGTISRLIEDSKKKNQTANVCLINCDTNGDGIADTNLDTDGDGICDTNCDSPVEQSGDGKSTDGKQNENPKETKKDQGSPTVKVVTENQGGNTVVKVVESKNSDVIKYENGNKKIEYFTSGNGQTIAIGEYVIIGNTGTITIYAGNGTGGGTTTQIDIGGGEDTTPPDFEVIFPEGYSNNPEAQLRFDKNEVSRIKVMRGNKTLEDVKADGKDISINKTSYSLCGDSKTKDSCEGTWTFAAWDKAGNGITETKTFNKFDNTKPSFTIDGDFITPKKTVTAIIQASDDNDNGLSDYFTIYYTNGRKTASEIENLSVCSDNVVDNCKFRLTNKEHLGIRTNDTYTFIVYDQAGNYETSFTKTGGEEINTYLTVENANSELTAPTFILSSVGWSVEKTVTITYPDGGLGTYEYSLDGGNTWNVYMDPIRFTDDGTVHEIIARVMDGEYALTASSIVITKLDNGTPEFELGLVDNSEVGIGANMPLPKTTNKDSLKSGATTECQYKESGTNTWKNITNINQITAIGYYDFKCNMTSGAGKTATEATVSHVEFFIPVYITFDAKRGTFGDDICDGNPSYSYCSEDRKIAKKSIKKGHAIGDVPTVELDGYTLTGWYAKDGSIIDSGMKPTTDMEFEAGWKDGFFNVTFDGNGGKINNKDTYVAKVSNGGYTLESTLAGLTNPTSNDGVSSFVGWFDAPEGGNKVDKTTVVDKSITYYAHWMNSQNVNLVSFISDLGMSGAYTTLTSKDPDGNVRFVGSNAENYVDLNNDGVADFRIIGIFNVATSNGNKRLAKLISTSPLSGTYTLANESFGNNTALINALNSSSSASYAETVTWKIPSVLLSDDVVTAYNKMKSSSETYSGKVGLLYASDIIYSRTTGSMNSTVLQNIESYSSSWINNMISDSTYSMNKVSGVDSSYGPYAAYFTGRHRMTSFAADKDLIVYPVIYIPENAMITTGNGSARNPYSISIN